MRPLYATYLMIFAFTATLVIGFGEVSTFAQVPQTAEELFARGNKSFLNEDWDAAIADYTAAIKIKPAASGAFGNRGRAYAKRGAYLCCTSRF